MAARAAATDIKPTTRKLARLVLRVSPGLDVRSGIDNIRINGALNSRWSWLIFLVYLPHH
jgi:DNA integrity scanning protein DisA with diadenylate cyclase activity